MEERLPPHGEQSVENGQEPEKSIPEMPLGPKTLSDEDSFTDKSSKDVSQNFLVAPE